MPKLKDRNTKPFTGWTYLQAETECWLEADNIYDLQKKVREHREYKGLSTENVEDDVEQQLCMRLGINWCMKERGEQWEPFTNKINSLGIEQIQDASAFAIEMLKSGLPLVSEEVAKQRAEICRKCPFNQEARHCKCTPFYKIVEALIPNNRKENSLHICGICGCSLKVKVLMPQEVIEKDNANKQRKYPTNCWQLHHG